MNNHELIFKALRVINSCNKTSQLDVAGEFCSRVSDIIANDSTNSYEHQLLFEHLIKIKAKQILDRGKNL